LKIGYDFKNDQNSLTGRRRRRRRRRFVAPRPGTTLSHLVKMHYLIERHDCLRDQQEDNECSTFLKTFFAKTRIFLT
jgi:hypothetical protein